MRERRNKMAKATHYGTCQCCGSYQKLPDGFLSNHGYTVEWNMFDGICSGAKHLPFEKDYSLVEQMIERSKSGIVSLNEQIKEVKSSTDSENVWKLEGKYWKQRKLIGEEIKYSEGEGSYFKFTWVYTDEELEGKRAYEVRYLTESCSYGRVESLEEAVKHENEKYANYLSNRVAGLESYIKWQEERVANWVEKELEEVEKKYTGPKSHLVNAFNIRIEEGKVKYKGRGYKSACGRSDYHSSILDFGKVYKENPEKCCKGCTKRFLELREYIKDLKEKA